MNTRQRLALLGLAVCIAALGETGNQPGQIETMRVAPFSAAAVNTTSNPTSTTYLTADERHERTVNRVWISSMLTMAAGTSMDAATSWGGREGNGLLAQGNGSFGVKGVGIKAGVAVAMIVPQVLLRKHKELKTPFIIGNFAEAGLFTGTAIHNIHVR